MKKNTKIIIGILSLVIVLCAGLVVILLLPSDDGNKESNSEKTDILLIEKSAFDVEEVSIKNEGGEYQILGYNYSKTLSSGENEDIPVMYTMQGYENSLLSKYMTDNLVKECQTIAATRIVDRSGKKYRDYGLDKPSVEVTAIYSDSSKAKFFFGDEAPDKSGTYCRIDGNKNVYLVNTGSVDMFFIDKLQLFDKSLTGDISDTESVCYLEISGKCYEKPIKVSSEKDNALIGEYIMTSPFREVCDNSKTVDFALSFYDFTLSEVAAAEVKADDIKKFGLSEPYMEIKVSTNEDNNVNILVSERDADGNCYIMCKGGNIIYKADKDEFKGYGIDYREFLNSSVYSPDISNAGAAEIFYNGRTYKYSIERKKEINDMYEENTITNVYCDGKEVSYGNIMNFVLSLSNIERTDNIPETLDGYERIFYIKLSFEKSEYMLELYKDGKNNITAVVDGNIECTVNTEFVQSVLDLTEKVPAENTVEIIENS